ncbi:MAG: TonB-dependent receptor [Bacteroidetes bacterium]|nr:TonB-dependent receptor [Bacteroidota bacterium]
MRKLIQLLCISAILYTNSYAQQTISGKVTDASTGTAMEGVSIQNTVSGVGITTNKEGAFSISANSTDKLWISFIGYSPQAVYANGLTSLNIQLVPSIQELGQVVMVGTRRPGRINTQTPVPIDVININQASLPTARMDLTSILNYAAPSFNYNKQSGSDGADHADLASLRGLGTDQTLVLINGKRRYQTAFVAVFGTRGRGNSGTDLNAIPVSSIDRIEILRDGASAQYGSDAIAGVINIILKKSTGKLTGDIGYSGYYDTRFNTWDVKQTGQYPYQGKVDGNAGTIGLNYGFKVGKRNGFINLSADLLANQKTFRQVLNNKITPNIEYSLPINYVRRAFGDGSLQEGGGMLNMELPLNEKRTTTFYAFGGYNYKFSDAYAFTRNFSTDPDDNGWKRTPTDANGNLIFVPGITMLADDGTYYFNPHIQTHVSDMSLAAGIRGKTVGGWNWDFSNVIGRNDFHFYGDKTFNASLGPNQNHFDDGGFNFLQNTANLNFSKEIPHVASGFNFAAGAEFRFEQYQLYAGEEASYKNYDPAKASGSQGFPGYQPSDAVKANRNNFAGYVDMELDASKRLLIGAAIRAENYSDFGFTSNYKISSRYKLTDFINLRGSFTTGFRAPSMQQINFSSTFTTVQGQQLYEVKIAPNYSPITKAAGIPDLVQEKSLTGSIGIAITPMPGFNITIDGYIVNIKNRVVLSGQFDASDATLDPALIAAMQQLNVSYAQFFANAVNTTNKGIDFVADYNTHWGKQSFRGLLTANFQNMNIDKINVPAKLNDTKDHQETFYSDREQAFLLASAPETKAALSLEYTVNKFSIGSRFTYFGSVTLLGYGEDGLGIDPMVPTDNNPNKYVPDVYPYHEKVIIDLFSSYQFNKSFTLYFGADNIFNIHPSLGAVANAKYWAFNNETGGPWDSVQMGGNGTRLFVRLAFNF